MTQALLYSIAPQHMLNILNGNKTIEVRKRDLPQWAKDKLARGEIVEGYMYCTKGGKRLSVVYDDEDGKTRYYINSNWGRSLNGDVVVKFEVDKILTFKPIYSGGYMYMNSRDYVGTTYNNVLEKACLSTEQLEEYGNGADLYAHHLTNIQPIEPMELGEFYGDFTYSDTDEYGRQHAPIHIPIPLKRAPQSFQSAWVKGE